jgi:hypothetical protein
MAFPRTQLPHTNSIADLTNVADESKKTISNICALAKTKGFTSVVLSGFTQCDSPKYLVDLELAYNHISSLDFGFNPLSSEIKISLFNKKGGKHSIESTLTFFVGNQFWYANCKDSKLTFNKPHEKPQQFEAVKDEILNGEFHSEKEFYPSFSRSAMWAAKFVSAMAEKESSNTALCSSAAVIEMYEDQVILIDGDKTAAPFQYVTCLYDSEPTPEDIAISLRQTTSALAEVVTLANSPDVHSVKSIEVRTKKYIGKSNRPYTKSDILTKLSIGTQKVTIMSGLWNGELVHRGYVGHEKKTAKRILSGGTPYEGNDIGYIAHLVMFIDGTATNLLAASTDVPEFDAVNQDAVEITETSTTIQVVEAE